MIFWPILLIRRVEVVMWKLVKREELIDRYLSNEERREIDQFYKDLGLGALLDEPPPDPEKGPLFGNSSRQTVNCLLFRCLKCPD